MKRFCLTIAIAMLCLFIYHSAVYAENDIEKHPTCKYCGMDRGKFAHSRIYIKYDDGSQEGMCSLRCAALGIAVNIDKIPNIIRVGDYNTKKLIDAEKAFWIVGGNKAGVMTNRAKWAFEKKEDAEAFKKGNGGNIATFDEAIKAAYEDMQQDSITIREKRRAGKKKMMEHMHH